MPVPKSIGASRFIDLLLVALSFALAIYVTVEYEALSFRIGEPSLLDIISSAIVILLVMEATRRMLGWRSTYYLRRRLRLPGLWGKPAALPGPFRFHL